MRDHAGIFSVMNGVIYYSNSGQSASVANYFSRETGWGTFDLNDLEQAARVKKSTFERTVLVFPVYCQNIPQVIKELLLCLKARYLAVVATYGKMCYGNVLYEAQRGYTAGKIVAAAYVPTKHSYLKEDEKNDFCWLCAVVDKLTEIEPLEVLIPKSYKNPLANVAKEWRSRAAVKILRDKTCIGCGRCEKECLFGGIQNGKTNKLCIRCMKCVTNCPVGALRFCNRLPLRLYLKKKKITKKVLYV